MVVKKLKTSSIAVCAILGVIAIPSEGLAINFNPAGPFVDPAPGSIIPTPHQVPGKEFSDFIDRDHLDNPDPEQTLLWDGLGGTADGFDYGGNGEVDAMANFADALFGDVTNNKAALLFSVEGDNQIYFESITGEGGIWATAPVIDGNNPITDVDGLEVWGPVADPDANRYSLAGDPGGTSVFSFDSATGMSAPLITTADIAEAIGVGAANADEIEVDAMMTFGEQANIAEILFSIAPTNALGFDGGEIWLWNTANQGLGAANFLDHGGHLWDTAFDVQGTFGVASENINALEAASVPFELETGVALGIVGLFGFLKSKKRAALKKS